MFDKKSISKKELRLRKRRDYLMLPNVSELQASEAQTTALPVEELAAAADVSVEPTQVDLTPEGPAAAPLFEAAPAWDDSPAELPVSGAELERAPIGERSEPDGDDEPDSGGTTWMRWSPPYPGISAGFGQEPTPSYAVDRSRSSRSGRAGRAGGFHGSSPGRARGLAQSRVVCARRGQLAGSGHGSPAYVRRRRGNLGSGP